MGLSTTLSAAPRDPNGSNSARRLRKEGLVPAVLYGDGLEPLSISLNYLAVKKAFLNDPGNRSLFTLEVEGKGSWPIVVKALQIHPVARTMLHVDFQKVDPEKKVVVKVPLTLK